ncbi:long-chain acyl-CoA synthetase [Marinobacter segnicrescens]|uniref:Long-chain acyl-CoA synthetase n=1 Tax=Marinobacter segnicrescens TaxID=430453 RepID=A0A1I0A345_9GAMM|nr:MULTISPECIES: long-chain-fatty-acid--CoA ligase [Marinobacter]UZD66160.1 long-chain-fatty-acid--CoA ligase [Marinobacter sp. AN1]SES88121.1 long-chain acyl-CoA synthetase [Marinobacter segnicrescens]
MILTDLPEQSLERFGEYTMLYAGEREVTNLELQDSANRLANGLHNLGVKPGDRVVVCMPNSPEVFIAYQAVLRAGAIVLPVMFVLHPREIGFILQASGASAVITSQAILPSIEQATSGMETPPKLVVAGIAQNQPSPNAGIPCNSLCSLMAAADPEIELPPIKEDDVAVILFTSGTTGQPKGVMLTHRNLYSNAASAVQLAEEAGDEPGTTIGVLPLAHIYGFTMANTLFLRGSSVVILPKFDVREVFEAVQKHKVTAFSAVPAMIYALTTAPEAEEYDLTSLESVGSGSAPLPVSLIEAFRKRFNAEIYEGYGLSEAAPTVSAHRKGEPVKAGSVGRAFPGVELRIADELGNPLAVGEVGELLVRGENITPGYYNNEEATRAALKDGWLHTGDVARLDEDGYLYIVDRKKDLILRGGFNIYPRDLEELISRHPAVAEVAVVGVPSERMGEEVVAVVVRNPDTDITEEELLAFCQERLAKYKTPRKVVFMEAMPRNGVGKILKKSLREQVAEQVEID